MAVTRIVLAIVLFAGVACSAAVPNVHDAPTDAAAGLLQRLIPKHAHNFDLEIIPGEGDKMVYEIEGGEGGRIVLRGSNSVALASALNWYLKYMCNAHVSWAGDQLELPAVLPVPAEKTRTVSTAQWSYYMNVCTVSYSAVWWDWARWEREIDWMALNGINLPLAFTGQEYVWRELFREYNLTDSEMSEFFSGPAFFAWQRMGNMRGWGGPLSNAFIDAQMVLQTKILARMRQYGMTPVLPAFAGHVPQAFTKIFPNATITRSARWGNFPDDLCCVYFLDPSDKLFLELGSRFIALQTKIFGTDHYYNCDQFNEMTPSSSDPAYLTEASKAVYQSMTTADPDAVWIMQGWLFFNDAAFWHLPQIKGLLDGVPNSGMIILDLFSDVEPVWQRTQSYFGKPYIWCMLHNFGGNLGMYGVVPALNTEPYKALAAENSTMVGIGLTMEGIDQNYFVYEFMAETMWRAPTDIEKWMAAFVRRRYGFDDGSLSRPWVGMLSTVFNCTTGQYGVTKSIANLRPDFGLVRDGFMPTRLHYDPAVLDCAWRDFARAAMRASAEHRLSAQAYVTLGHDVVDVTRQALSNMFLAVYSEFSEASEKANLTAVTATGARLLELIKDMDLILGTSEFYLVGRWIAAARALAADDAEADLLEMNARNQVTMWGPDAEISDYASKDWAGLMGSYYYRRWEIFVSAVHMAASARSAFSQVRARYVAQVVAFEQQWQLDYATEYTTRAESDPMEVAMMLTDKYPAASKCVSH